MCRDTGIADDTEMGIMGFGDTGDTWLREQEPAETFLLLWDVLLASETAPGFTPRLSKRNGGHFPYKNKPLPQDLRSQLPRRSEISLVPAAGGSAVRGRPGAEISAP